MSENEGIVGRVAAAPAAEDLDTRRAIAAMAMSSGRHLLDAPFVHLSLMAV